MALNLNADNLGARVGKVVEGSGILKRTISASLASGSFGCPRVSRLSHSPRQPRYHLMLKEKGGNDQMCLSALLPVLGRKWSRERPHTSVQALLPDENAATGYADTFEQISVRETKDFRFVSLLQLFLQWPGQQNAKARLIGQTECSSDSPVIRCKSRSGELCWRFLKLTHDVSPSFKLPRHQLLKLTHNDSPPFKLPGPR
eukprot:3359334-Rhodomonas_salina.2